jgi:hypothetical protein
VIPSSAACSLHSLAPRSDCSSTSTPTTSGATSSPLLRTVHHGNRCKMEMDIYIRSVNQRRLEMTVTKHVRLSVKITCDDEGKYTVEIEKPKAVVMPDGTRIQLDFPSRTYGQQ